LNSILELNPPKVIVFKIKNLKFKKLNFYIFFLKKLIFMLSKFILFVKKNNKKRYKYKHAFKVRQTLFLKKIKSNFLFIELKKTQVFFIFLNSLLKVFKTFSCGVVLKLLHVSKKCAKKKKSNFFFLNIFLKKYFSVFLIKNATLVIKSFLFKYTEFVLKLLEFTNPSKTNVIFVSKINLNLYKFRRIKAIKKNLKKKLK
jgi:hypothetical protein